MKCFFFKLLITSFLLLPLAVFAQEATSSPEIIPVYFFLHHNSDIALGVLAVAPLDEETLLWVYAPLEQSGFGDDSTSSSQSSDTAPQLTFNFSDHLGSVAISTDKTGSVKELSDYFPYGNIRLDQKNGLTEQRKYIGQEFDAQTNLNYLNARYYDSAKGEFLSQDPTHLAIGDKNQVKRITGQSQQAILTDPQNLNSYSYARNNPLKFSDPGGKNPFLIVGGAAFVASVSWNLGSDFYHNYQDVRAGNLPWYMITQGRGENPGIRYFKNASEAALVAVGATGAEMAAPLLLPEITAGGAQIIGATTAGLGSVGVSFLNGNATNPETGKINTLGLATNFAAGFFGARIGQQIPNPVGRPPTTVTGSLAGARAITEQLRTQLDHLVQALSAYVTTLGTPKSAK